MTDRSLRLLLSHGDTLSNCGQFGGRMPAIMVVQCDEPYSALIDKSFHERPKQSIRVTETAIHIGARKRQDVTKEFTFAAPFALVAKKGGAIHRSREVARPAEVSMTELLNLAVKAHGGLDRWNKVKAIKVAASITGAIWYVKGKPDVLKNVV